MDKKNKVKRIFDTISKRYDFLNHFLSLGIDFYWRKKALKLTDVNTKSRLLDLACGTGDFAISAKKNGVSSIIGADLSVNMLRVFEEKSTDIKGKLVQSIGEELPFKAESFSNITVGFGVRNFFNIPSAFNEFNRVLLSEGKATVLEFRLPKNFIFSAIYNFYFNWILPTIGKLVSKDNEAYKYLPESVKEFDKEIDLVKLFEDAGFTLVEKHSLTLGIVQVVIATK